MLNIISLGAGVQSSTMALMAAHGEITPMPDAAIFSDTQAEPQEVYDWLSHLEALLPFPVYRVTHKNLEKVATQWRMRKGRPSIDIPIPMFAAGSPIGRDCTRDFKVKPLERKVKELLGLKRSDRWPTELSVSQWLGISFDEIQRMKVSVTKWQEFRHPLIEIRMTRGHCLEWMRDNGYPEPPRSACYFCPFHSNEEWNRLAPEEFDRAIKFEQTVQAMSAFIGELNHAPTLHRDGVTIDKANLTTAESAGQISWLDECAGMCGV